MKSNNKMAEMSVHSTPVHHSRKVLKRFLNCPWKYLNLAQKSPPKKPFIIVSGFKQRLSVTFMQFFCVYSTHTRVLTGALHVFSLQRTAQCWSLTWAVKFFPETLSPSHCPVSWYTDPFLGSGQRKHSWKARHTNTHTHARANKPTSMC